MNPQELSNEISDKIVGVVEQLQNVNRIIAVHADDEDDFMLDQYKHQKSVLLQEFKDLLGEIDISPADLVT